MLKHVSFITTHPDEVLRFYTALGATVIKDITTHEGYRRIVLRFVGGGKLQFLVIEGEQRAPYPHWAEHIALILPDLTTSLARLQTQDAGLSRAVQASPSGRAMAFVIDPDGRQVELLQEEEIQTAD